MNKGIQNLAADYVHVRHPDEDLKVFKDKKYSLVQNEVQREFINDRVDKNPKNFSPYDFDALYKIVLIGESNTGKTSMLCRYADNIFNEHYLCTIGVDFKIKTLKVDNKIIKMQIWDTAGQERFRSISQAYYRNSHGCVAIYDITNRQSFDAIEEQIQSFLSYSAQDVARNIILVGNKTDLEDQRKVTFEEAVQFAKKLQLAAVFETSAKSNDSIDEVFFRSIVNCVDFYNVGGDEPLISKSGPRSRIFSAQAELHKRKRSFNNDDKSEEVKENNYDLRFQAMQNKLNQSQGVKLQQPQQDLYQKGAQLKSSYRKRGRKNSNQGCC